jgi:hypothetical protein
MTMDELKIGKVAFIRRDDSLQVVYTVDTLPPEDEKPPHLLEFILFGDDLRRLREFMAA